MLNRVALVGRLTRDPELRSSGNGTAVTSFTLAVDRNFSTRDGQEADFINCVMWRKPAENFANFTHKGSLVGIDGRIQTRSYENQHGTRVYVTEVVAENFSLLESRAEADRYREQHGMTQNNYGNNAPSQNQASQFDSNPFGDSQSNNSFGGNTPANNGADNSADPFADNGQSIDISDDDLPF